MNRTADIASLKNLTATLVSDALMATASVLYLVSFAHCLAQTGDLDSLKNWWNTKVSPLLR
jgi:hypothetical protein